MNDVNDTGRSAVERGHSPYHSHYGFNWRTLRETVREHLVVESTHFSPLGFTRGLASSQAWFVCRPIPSSVSGR
jgi:hypothetical protein